MKILKYSDLNQDILNGLQLQLFVLEENQSFSRTSGPKVAIGTGIKDAENRNVFYVIDVASDVSNFELSKLNELTILVAGNTKFDIEKYIEIFGLGRHLELIKVFFSEDI